MFIQIIQGRSSRRDELHAAMDRWHETCEPGAEGWLGGTYGFTDDDEFIAVVRFESEEAAMANSRRPEQDAWWSETATLFEGPVEFHNCRDVSLMLEGGSDTAGFVQVIQGKVDEPERLRSMVEEMSHMLREQRPEVIGATLAIEDDGTFTETVAFTDEASAREGERKEVPEGMLESWTSAVHDLSYHDLHHPWFASKG